ncbi:MAG: asparagine synthase (glutamine-hydrolyzing) [Pseudomonadota bacterium]
MCGIAGFFLDGPDQEARARLRDAVAALGRRGPDGSGFHYRPGLGLGHARLAIIDLETGNQPLFNEDESLALVVNGEFYNYRELYRDLEPSGRPPLTRSDSEVFIHLYEKFSLDQALNRLNGMWALALWDDRRKRLVLSRDRAGKKPLYYTLVDGGIIFASELKAILAFPQVDRTLCPTALALYLRHGYIPDPYSIYRGIKKLPPACHGVFEDGVFRIEKYWSRPREVDHATSEDSWLEELDALLRDSVRLRLASDVPLGVFLSGGLDSSLIAAEVVRYKGGETESFSIGFESSYDESPYARMVSRALGTRGHIDQVNLDVLDLAPRVISYFDEPFADSSALPTWLLCRSTKRGVSVALSGDGGDELFGGYRRYLAARLTGLYLALPGFLRRGAIEPLIDRLPAPGEYYGRSWSKKAKLFAAAAARREIDPLALSPRLFADQELADLMPGLPLPGPALDPTFPGEDQLTDPEPAQRMMKNDFGAYLPGDILTKVDRMSMFHALEVRCPFLDHRIVELAFRLPLKYKINGLTSKYILRRLGEKKLPPSIPKRSKQGFMLPLDVWFRRELKEFIQDLLFSPSAPWSRTEAEKILNQHLSGRHDRAPQLWGLAVLAMFNRR